MIEAVAAKLAHSIKRANPEDTASIEVLKYSLNLILNPAVIILISSIIGYAIGRLTEMYIVLISFALLRIFSGGYHLKSSGSCVLLTTSGATLLSFADFSYGWNVALTTFSLIMVAVFAPFSTHRTTLIHEKYNPLLKAISIAIVCSNYIFASSLLSAAFFIQAASLINLQRKGVSRK